MSYQHNPLGLDLFDDSEPWYLFSLGPAGSRWFGPSGDCGCCGGVPCCDGEICLVLDLTIGTAGCCDIGNHVIIHDQESTAGGYCVFNIDPDEYPPAVGVFPATPIGVYWLTDYLSNEAYDDCLALSVDACHTESLGSITYEWFPALIVSDIKTSTSNGHVIITVRVDYIVRIINPGFPSCSFAGGGYVLYTFESNNCLAGPFTLTDTLVVPSGFRSWVPPECDVEINDVYECV